MPRKKYREIRYIMGDYLDIQICPVFKNPKGKRKPRFRPSSEAQERLNEENSFKYVDRLAHTNFGPGDLSLDLTYAVQPATPEEAQRYIQNFFRRLKKHYKAAGIEMKYIYVTERGLKNGRFHHHVIINGGVDRDTIESVWHVKDYAGFANCDRLQFGPTGIAGKIAYITGKKNEKREEKKCGFRRWSSSKNLVRLEPKKSDSRFTNRTAEELFSDCDNRQAWERLYPDYFFAECDKVYYNPVNGGYYLTARMYKKGAAVNGARRC